MSKIFSFNIFRNKYAFWTGNDCYIFSDFRNIVYIIYSKQKYSNTDNEIIELFEEKDVISIENKKKRVNWDTYMGIERHDKGHIKTENRKQETIELSKKIWIN